MEYTEEGTANTMSPFKQGEHILTQVNQNIDALAKQLELLMSKAEGEVLIQQIASFETKTNKKFDEQEGIVAALEITMGERFDQQGESIRGLALGFDTFKELAGEDREKATKRAEELSELCRVAREKLDENDENIKGIRQDIKIGDHNWEDLNKTVKQTNAQLNATNDGVNKLSAQTTENFQIMGKKAEKATAFYDKIRKIKAVQKVIHPKENEPANEMQIDTSSPPAKKTRAQKMVQLHEIVADDKKAEREESKQSGEKKVVSYNIAGGSLKLPKITG